MASLLFVLSLVLIFNTPSHLVMSTSESQVAPNHHHSTQIVNFSTGSFLVNVPKQQNSSSPNSLSQLQLPFQTPSLSSSAERSTDNSPKIPGTSTTQIPIIRSQRTTGANESGDGGRGRRNFNDNFVSTPADFTLPQPSAQLSQNKKEVAVPVPSFWSFLESDMARETAERRKVRKRRSLSTRQPKNGGILQASNSNLNLGQEDQENLVLKLDRNYTPKDIADYIISTGDERGIIQVVADLVQDGQLMASRDDVILFLETVQRELNKLKALNQLHRPSPSA